jgi:MFS family permease
VDETPSFREEATHGELPPAPIVSAVKESGSNMLRVVCMALMNVVAVLATTFGATFATNQAYGVGMDTKLYLFIPVIGNVVAMILIPFVGAWSDRIGRRPPIIVGALGSGLLAFPYLYFISQNNVALTILFAILMWAMVYQGYNSVFPSFYQELFPTRNRVTAFAVSQNIGTMITAFLPTIYAALAGPTSGCTGTAEFLADGVTKDPTYKKFLPTQECLAQASDVHTTVIWVVGGITFALTVVAAISAFSARETFKIHLNDCGEKWAKPVSDEEYAKARLEAANA